jgi:hypothetical protein
MTDFSAAECGCSVPSRARVALQRLSGIVFSERCRSASTLNPPHHVHICLICKGDYPCWGLRCALSPEIICNDCSEETREENYPASQTVH